MYINIPGGFEIVPLKPTTPRPFARGHEKLEEMLADNEIAASANDMIVTLYVPRGAVRGLHRCENRGPGYSRGE